MPNGVRRGAGDEQASSADSRQSHFGRGAARPEYPLAGNPGHSRWGRLLYLKYRIQMWPIGL